MPVPSLKPMLDFVLNEIPEDQWSSSPILLKATAGLRMVAEGPQRADPRICQRCTGCLTAQV